MVEKSRKKFAFQIVIDTIKYLFPTAWHFRKGYFFIQVIYTICRILEPFVSIMVLPLLIDEMIGDCDINKLIKFSLVLVIGETFLSLSSSLLQLLLEKYDVLFQNFYSEALSRKVMELDFPLTEDKKTLDQIEKARTGMDWYSGGVHGIANKFFEILSDFIKMLGVVVLLLLNAPILLIVTIILLFIGTLLTASINKVEMEYFGDLATKNRILGYIFYEMTQIKNGKDIRLFRAKEMMLEKCRNQVESMTGSWKLMSEKQFPFRIGIMLTGVARNLVSYLYLGALVIYGKISIGVFSQMLSVGATFHNVVKGGIDGIQDIIKRSNYAYEYVKFMKYPDTLEKGNERIHGQKHTFEFCHVSFSYPNSEVNVLNDVSITINPGDHLSIVGLNGAGKTTFIKLLCRLYDVDSGEILLDGRNIKDYDYKEYMRLFSVVFQDFRLLSFTARENIVLDSEMDDLAVNDVIKKIGLEDKFKSLPNGIDTMIFKQFDENGIEPSGGEQQKLAIARALYKNSPVVILDEPTATLDPLAEYEIYKHFNSIVGDNTAIYISHRLSSCKFCDRILVFSNGMIKESGTHDQLVEIPNGIYAKMYSKQAKYYN